MSIRVTRSVLFYSFPFHLLSEIITAFIFTAPSHCLQHHTGTYGRLKSFNYDQEGGDEPSKEGYPNDHDYTICVRKESGFCTITYELATQGSTIKPFSVGPSVKSGRVASFQTQCKDDFLVVAGIRLCSVTISDGLPNKTVGSYSGAILNATYTSPSLITDSTPGPFAIRFVSSQADNGKGFDLSYRQNPCK